LTSGSGLPTERNRKTQVQKPASAKASAGKPNLGHPRSVRREGELLREVEAAEENLEARVGAERIPVAGDGEMGGGCFVGANGFFEPGEGDIVFTRVGVETRNAHGGDVGVLRTSGENVAATLHGFAIATRGEARVESVDRFAIVEILEKVNG